MNSLYDCPDFDLVILLAWVCGHGARILNTEWRNPYRGVSALPDARDLQRALH